MQVTVVTFFRAALLMQLLFTLFAKRNARTVKSTRIDNPQIVVIMKFGFEIKANSLYSNPKLIWETKYKIAVIKNK